MAVSVTRTAQTSSGTNASSYTFSSTAIGTASSDRLIAVTFMAVANVPEAVLTLSSATIGGTTANIEIQQTSDSGSNDAVVGIITAAVPSGTTASIVLNFSASCFRAGIIVYSVTGANHTPTGATSAWSVNTDTRTVSLTVPGNGAAIGVDGGSATPPFGVINWTGLTSDHLINGPGGESGYVGTAILEPATTQTSLSISAEVQVNFGLSCLAAIAFEEASSGTSITLVGDTFTLSTNTLGVNAEVSLSLSGDVFIKSAGTLTITQETGIEVTITPATFTITAGTLGVRAEVASRVTPIPDTFTKNLGTLTIRAENATRVGLINDTLTLSGGALGIQQAISISILQDTFNLIGAVMTITQGEQVEITTNGMLAAKHIRRRIHKR